MPTERDAHAILERLADESDRLALLGDHSADAVRMCMAARRVEMLTGARVKLLKSQRRAVDLMRRVDFSVPMNLDIVPMVDADRDVWTYARHILSSAPWIARPGRAMFWLCIDRKSRGLVGVIDLGSDLENLSPRDAYLGWSREQKFHRRGLTHLVNLGTCVASQPFGWLTGGKFMAVVATSAKIVDALQYRYGQVLAGVTTTSLFGRLSQYNRLTEYRYLGNTSGQGTYHLSTADFHTLQDFLGDSQIPTRARHRGLAFTSRHETLLRATTVLNFTLLVTSHQPRGVYLALLGEDARGYLRGDLNEFQPIRRDVTTINAWWHERWYVMRWPKVEDQIRCFDWRTYEVDAQIDLAKQMSQQAAA